MGLKPEQRSRMYTLSPEQKKWALRQERSKPPATSSRSSPLGKTGAAGYAASYGPSSGAGIIPRLMPQLTGDAGIMKRFSIVGWGQAEASTPPSTTIVASPVHEVVLAAAAPLQPQTTGGLWSNWFSSSAGEKPTSDKNLAELEKTPKWYVDTVKALKATTDSKLFKNLISLRVHLSTAKVGWIAEFVEEARGVDVLAGHLAGLVGKGGKTRVLTEMEGIVLFEVIKCFRVLLNTDVRPPSPSLFQPY